MDQVCTSTPMRRIAQGRCQRVIDSCLPSQRVSLADMPPFDLSKIATLAGSGLSVQGYRNQASGFDPRSGDGARRFGGRFNRPHSYPVVYLCTTRSCVVAELTRQARRQGLAVEDLLPRELWRVTAVLTTVLDLTDAETLQALGVEPDELDRKSTRLNSSHIQKSRMPSSA